MYNIVFPISNFYFLMDGTIKQNWHLYKLSTHPFYFCNLLLINHFLVFDMNWNYDIQLSYATKDLFFFSFSHV